MKLLSLLSSSLLTATLLLAVSPAFAQEAPVKKKIAITKIDATDALKARIERELGWTVRTPAHQERIELP